MISAARPPLRALPSHAAWRIRFLGNLVRRDLAARYKGSVFGWLWPLLVQLSQLLVFTYLFASIFKVRLDVPGFPASALTYGLWLFTGLVMWNMFTAGILGAASTIVSQANVVKKVVFPLALMPLVPVGSALVEGLAGFAVVIVLAVAISHQLHAAVLLLPLVVAVQVVLTAGVAYFVAGLTVFMRDVPQMLGPLTLLAFYLTPIVYPATRIPPSVAWIVTLNPIAITVEASRSLILTGSLSHPRALVLAAIVATIVFVAGWRFFRRVRPIFADIL
uniref:Teichoic acid translocation permease protein TagG n=1 Tax=uncultured organism TaxID=155900 RepID=A0A7L9QC14_9ZZZZ|nr:teichoic acid translocation permease protein TagG [uncultured organism]